MTSAAAQSGVSATELTVFAGYGRSGPQFVVEEFFPRTIRVGTGTTVTWVQETPREHTVTFLAGQRLPAESIPQPEDPSLPQMRNPLAEYPTLPDGPYDGSYFINSGRVQAGESFSVTFSAPGIYEFVCIPHLARDDMRGTVEVVPPGTQGIMTQEDIDREVEAEFAVFERQASEIMASRDVTAGLDGLRGSTTWFVRVGTDQRSEADGRVGRMTVRAFLPDRLSIRRGDTVVWYTDTRVPRHNVVFPVGGLPPSRWAPRLDNGSLAPLELLAPTGVYRGDPGSLDWPRILEDTSVEVPSRPAPTYDPTKYFVSPQLGDIPTGRAWSLTFDTAGTFSYFCVPHANIGMIGQVTVTAS